MCCFAARKKPAICTAVCAGLGIVGACLMGYFSFEFKSNSLLTSIPAAESITATIFLVLIIAASVALALGILGTLLICIRHRCYTVIYGILLFFIWVVNLVVGVALVFVATAGN